MKSINRILILLDVRSAQNVGSLFRTADAAGIDHMYLVGITPTPTDRFGRANTAVAKTALGAEATIPWSHKAKIGPLLAHLKKQGVMVIAIEQSPHAVDYKKVKVRLPAAFMLGNEVDGIPKRVLAKADVVAEIPMQGNKESLNVSVAGGIALFCMLRV